MPFTLPELPYAKDALAPYMSQETFEYHYGKHHNAYVTKLNELSKGTEYENLSVEEIIKKAPQGGLFNQAAQHFNHSFFWKSMKPQGGVAPTEGAFFDAVVAKFGSWDAFVAEIKNVAAAHFGSGWAFVVLDKDGKLAVEGHHDASNPLVNQSTPLLALDVWEHAYYIDYRNNRPQFITVFLEHLVNWDFAAENFANAQKQ